MSRRFFIKIDEEIVTTMTFLHFSPLSSPPISCAIPPLVCQFISSGILNTREKALHPEIFHHTVLQTKQYRLPSL